MTPDASRSRLRQRDADSLVGRVADEFLDRLNRGERPDVQQYLRRYPQVESVLREVLPALQLIGTLEPAADPLAAPGAPTPSDGDSEAGRIGDFRILREIGRGGMGVVYEAEQISLRRRVALKVLPFAAALDPRHLQRFRTEAQAAAHLQHQNIVPVHAVGCERGVHYYAMQFVEGRTLAQIIAELRELNGRAGSTARSTATSAFHDTSTRSPAFFRTVARLGAQAAEGLEHAHQLGVVHRDVKPANLLIDARQNLWITDFGLAQVSVAGDTRLTITGDLLGTLRYMSPEQALAKRTVLDHRTDIYSLGATLYEWLTLEAVFDGQNREELLRQIAFDEPAPPRRVNPAVPIELETIVLKALSKNPDERFATAQELADDLLRFLRDEPIRSRRPTMIQRAAKWSRRHPALVRSLVVILLIGVAALAVSTVMISKAKQQAEAREAETRAALDFVQNKIFAAARPTGVSGGLGRDVTLREALEAALPFVQTSFADQPLIEARLRMTLASSFWYLGDATRSAEQAEAAHAIRARLLGPDHPETLQAMTSLANGYHALGRNADALALRERTLASQKARLGLDHVDTLRAMNNLSVSYLALGRYQDACDLREQTLARMRSALGPDHPMTLTAARNLASSYTTLGRYEEALKLHEQTRKLLTEKLGPDHPDTLGSAMSVAGCYAMLGRLTEAARLEEETLRVQRAKLGNEHPDTLLTMNNLADTYSRLARHEHALALRQEARTTLQARFGPEHPSTLWAMSALASSYLALQRNDQALDLYRQVVDRQRTQMGHDHPDTLQSMDGLANCYLAVGRAAEAVELHEQTLALRQARLGAEHPVTLPSMQNLATALAALGRHEEALRLRQRVLALVRQKVGPEDSDVPPCLWAVGESLVALGRAAEAEPLLLEACRVAEREENRALLPSSVERLVQVYEKLGKSGEAAPWRAKLEQLVSTTQSTTSTTH